MQVHKQPEAAGLSDLRNTDRQRSIITGCAGAISAPFVTAIVADELQSVEIAVTTAAIRAFEFHGRKN